jgi:hypothetical protein
MISNTALQELNQLVNQKQIESYTINPSGEITIYFPTIGTLQILDNDLVGKGMVAKLYTSDQAKLKIKVDTVFCQLIQRQIQLHRQQNTKQKYIDLKRFLMITGTNYVIWDTLKKTNNKSSFLEYAVGLSCAAITLYYVGKSYKSVYRQDELLHFKRKLQKIAEGNIFAPIPINTRTGNKSPQYTLKEATDLINNLDQSNNPIDYRTLKTLICSIEDGLLIKSQDTNDKTYKINYNVKQKLIKR